MKNKKSLSFFLIIFYFLCVELSNSEEIIFETPEIQVFENGNILKANKGGKAVIDKNTEIIADKFEYNKLTKVLTAKGNAQGIDSLNKITIDADELEYDKTIFKFTAYKNVKVVDSIKNVVTEANKIIYLRNQEKILSEGKTKITIENKYIINSKNIVWLRNEGQISSNEHTTLNDDKNNYYEAKKFRYLIKKKLFRGNEVSLNTNKEDQYFFKDVFINLETNELHGKDLEVNFNNNTFGNQKNEPRLKGNTGYSNENTTTVSKGIFTTCKKRPNEKCPPWLVEAKEVKHDKNKKIISYKNAWLKIYGVPVLYYPYFFHPDPTVERQSGFLTPQIGESQTLGSSAYIPYFYVISDEQDLTIKPRIFTDDKYSFQTEYRKASKKAKHIIDLSLTRGHNSSEKDIADSRSHFFSNSLIDLDTTTFDVSNIEIQLQKTSNNTYLKLFDLESPLFGDGGSSEVSTLHTFANFTANREDLNIRTTFEIYEKLDVSNSDRYEFVFPYFNINKNFDTYESLNGALSLNSWGSGHLFNTNVKETYIINDLLYQSQNKFLDNGIKNNYSILFKNVNSDAENSTQFKNDTQGKLLASTIFQSSYPLLREGINFNNYLTPKISLMYSPNKMKNLKNEKRRIDISNIFSLNRIGFGDVVESGQSLTIGADYKKTRKEKESDLPKDVFEASLATVFRDETNEDIPTSTSLGNKKSDVVGKIIMSPNNFFNTTYNFLMDNNLDQLKYSALKADFTVNNFVTSFKYIEERDSIGDEHYLENTTSYNFDENNSISFSTRENKKVNITEFYDLIYQYKNDCLTAAIQYNKDYYSDGDLKPTEQLFFSLTIVPLGAYETKNVLPN